MFLCLWIVHILLCITHPDLISMVWSLYLFSFNKCLCIMLKTLMLSKITIIWTTLVKNTDNAHVNDLAYYFFWKGNKNSHKNSVGHDWSFFIWRNCEIKKTKKINSRNSSCLFMKESFILLFFSRIMKENWINARNKCSYHFPCMLKSFYISISALQ